MENELLKLASSQGIWAVFSVVLLFYILKAQEKRDSIQAEREQKYQDIIFKLTDEFSIVNEIHKDISDIKNYINK